MSFEAWLATADEETLDVSGWGTCTIRELPRALQVRADRLRQQMEPLEGEAADKKATEFLLFILRHGLVDPKFTDEQLEQLLEQGSKKRVERLVFAIINLSVQLRPETASDEEVQAAERRFPS